MKSCDHHKLAVAAVIGWLLTVLLAGITIPSQASNLKEKTLEQWNRYIASTCLAQPKLTPQSAFLDTDDQQDAFGRLQAGKVLVWRNKAAKVPDGLINDWTGIIFIPHVSIARVLSISRDYNHYAEFYAPSVLKAATLSSEDDRDTYAMLVKHKVLFVTAAIQGQYETRYVQLDPKHWYSISQSTRLQAVENYGSPDMRLLPPDQGPGYVWRVCSPTRFQESEDGVFVEVRAFALSRGIPWVIRWFVGPAVDHAIADGMATALKQTRDAVIARDNPASQHRNAGSGIHRRGSAGGHVLRRGDIEGERSARRRASG
jgi:hypothetical protein